MNTNFDISEYFIRFLCCYPLNILIVILFIKFLIQTGTYVIALIKKQQNKDTDENGFNKIVAMLWYFPLVSLTVVCLSDIMSFDKQFIFTAVILSSLNTIVDFLLHTWLCRAKGMKNILTCSIFLILLCMLNMELIVNYGL